MSRGLSSAALKGIAMLCMTLDHAAYLFAPFGSPVWCVLRFLGRLAMPVFCFQAAEGFAHTRNPGRYAARLGLLAVLSQLPFSWMERGGEGGGLLPLSVAATLLCGVLAVWALNAVRPVWLAVLPAACCVLLSSCADWGITGVLWIVGFWLSRENRRRQIAVYLLIAAGYFLWQVCTVPGSVRAPVLLMTSGLFLAPLPLCLYNGRRGGGRLPAWTFYLYYPAHMAALTALFSCLNG